MGTHTPFFLALPFSCRLVPVPALLCICCLGETTECSKQSFRCILCCCTVSNDAGTRFVHAFACLLAKSFDHIPCHGRVSIGRGSIFFDWTIPPWCSVSYQRHTPWLREFSFWEWTNESNNLRAGSRSSVWDKWSTCAWVYLFEWHPCHNPTDTAWDWDVWRPLWQTSCFWQPSCIQTVRAVNDPWREIEQSNPVWGNGRNVHCTWCACVW